MILLHRVGERVNSNFNTLEEILALPPDVPLSFDGIYFSVFESARRLAGRDVTLFVMGDYVGGDNTFDVDQPHSVLCDWNQILAMCVEFGWKLGWHTWSHRNLCLLDDDEVRREIHPPIPMPWFAYPYGEVDTRVARLVEEAGYEEAWSVVQGNGQRFQRRRQYLNW